MRSRLGKDEEMLHCMVALPARVAGFGYRIALQDLET